MDHVVAIYARENGQGMAFPVPTESNATGTGAPSTAPEPARSGLRLATPAGGDDDDAAAAPERQAAADEGPADRPPESPTPAPGGRPSLKRVK